MSNIIEYARSIRELLSYPWNLEKEKKYLDLAERTSLNKEILTANSKTLPEENPLAEATFSVISNMEKANFLLVKIGINEILKAFLLNINKNNEKLSTKVIADNIYEIYLYSLKKDFPYTDLLWDYLSNCIHTVCHYLVNEGYAEGCEILLQLVATMGKSASQKGLHTSSIQHFLHTLELRAKELGFFTLAAAAKNYRFNLELF